MYWDTLLDIDYPDQVKSEFEFWVAKVCHLNSRNLASYSYSSVIIYSDASDIAAGAFSVELDSKIFHNSWDNFEKLKRSTWREMKAIQLALQSFENVFQGKTLKWFTDNQNCVRIVKSGSMKEELQCLARNIFDICTKKCISIDIQWIPRTENEKADYISKMIDHQDWGVSWEFFNFLDEKWGPHTIDRFANSNNKKVERFNFLYWNPRS